MIKRIIITIIIALLIIPSAIAEEILQLSLNETIKAGIVNNLEIKISKEDVTITNAQLNNAISEKKPRLNLNASSGYNKRVKKSTKEESFEFMGEKFILEPTLNSYWNNDISVSLTQNLYTGGRISNNIQESLAKKEISIDNYELIKQDLIFKIIQSYWELKRQDLLVELNENIVKHNNQILNLANQRLQAGTIPEIEIEKAKVNLSNVNDDLIQAKTNRIIAENDLLILLNLINKKIHIVPIDEPEIYIVKPLTELTKNIELALDSRIELKQLDQEIKAKESALLIAKSNKYPQVNLFANYNFSGTDEGYKDALKELKARSWKVGLNLYYPLYDAQETKNNIIKANADIEQTKYKLELKKQSITYEVISAYNELNAALERIKIIKENLALAQENLRIAQLQYKLGVITTHDVNEYQVSFTKISTKYIQAMIDCKIQEAKLIKAIGGRLY